MIGNQAGARAPGSPVRVWVVVCCDNITGVASSLAKADDLYRCDHGQDSLCCFTEEREVDARPARVWQPSPRHGRAVEQLEQLALPV